MLLIQVDIFACSQSQDVIYSVFVKAQVSHGVCYDAKSETGPGILFSKLADSLFVSLTKQFHCLNLNKQWWKFGEKKVFTGLDAVLKKNHIHT